IGLQVLIHRVDEADPEVATEQPLAAITAYAVTQCFFQVGGEEAGLPFGSETCGTDLATARQVLTNKAGVRPVGSQPDPAVTPYRHHRELLGALQFEVEGELQRLSALIVQRRDRCMHAGAELIVGATRSEAQGLAVQAQLQVVADTADIADADREEGFFEAVETQLVAQPEARRQAKLTAELAVAAVKARLVNPAGTQLGTDMAFDHEALRQEIQTAATLTLLAVALAGLLVGFPLVSGLDVGQHQDRSGDLLAVAGAARNILQHLVAEALTLVDQAIDHQQGNHQ